MSGTVEAESQIDALKVLRQRGFHQSQVVEATVAPLRSVQSVGSSGSVRSDGPIQAKVAVRPVAPTPSPQPPATGVIRTSQGSDKDRFFLFSQISKQLKAGVNPAQGFHSVGRVSANKFRESLIRAGEGAEAGIPISESFARYPDLYPGHVIALIRAGETGGFLPDAAETISKQAGDAASFKRFHWFVLPILVNALAAIPLVIVFMQSFVDGYKLYEQDASLGPWGAIGQSFTKNLLGPLGLAALLVYVAFWIGFWMSRTPRFRRKRHKLALAWPVFGPRTRNESVAIFCWVLSRLSVAGISPQRAWELAVPCAPNEEMQVRLYQAGVKMREGSRLSEAVFGSNLFHEDYAPVIATGELTGDISGALQTLADASRGEFETSNAKARTRTGQLGCFAVFLTGAVITCLMAYFWYNKFFDVVLDGLDPMTGFKEEGIILFWR